MKIIPLTAVLLPITFFLFANIMHIAGVGEKDYPTKCGNVEELVIVPICKDTCRQSITYSLCCQPN